MPTTPFNSLFEMRPQPHDEAKHRLDVLSILYLRCLSKLAARTGIGFLPFNSLFEMRPGGWSKRYSYCTLSILYLRCAVHLLEVFNRQLSQPFNSLFEMRARWLT